MTNLWSAESILRAVGGHSLHEQSWVAEGVATTPALVQKGWLYVATENSVLAKASLSSLDIVAACAKGACAAIVERMPLQSPPSFPLIIVDDAKRALQALADAGLARAQPSVIGVWDKSVDRKPTNALSLLISSLACAYPSAQTTTLPVCANELFANLQPQTTHLLVSVEDGASIASRALSICFVPCIGNNPVACVNALTAAGQIGEIVVNAEDRAYPAFCALLKKRGKYKITPYGQKRGMVARLTSLKEKDYGSLATADFGRYLLTLPLGGTSPSEALDAVGAVLVLAQSGLSAFSAAEIMATKQNLHKSAAIAAQKTTPQEDSLVKTPALQKQLSIVDQLDRLLSGLISSRDDDDEIAAYAGTPSLKQMVG